MNKETTRKLFTFLLTIVILGTLAVCDTGGGGGGGGGGGTSKPAGVSTGGSGGGSGSDGGGSTGSGSGSVVITLPSGSSSRNINARAVYPDPAILGRLVYLIQLTSGSNTKTETARSGETVTVNVSVGRWRVYVEALDGSSVYGVGENFVDVVAGQPNSVFINLSPPTEPTERGTFTVRFNIGSWRNTSTTGWTPMDPSEVTGDMPDQIFTIGVSQPLRKNAFVATGYEFRGWAPQDAMSGGSTFYDEHRVPGPETNFPSVSPGAIIDLYARWDKDQAP